MEKVEEFVVGKVPLAEGKVAVEEDCGCLRHEESDGLHDICVLERVVQGRREGGTQEDTKKQGQRETKRKRDAPHEKTNHVRWAYTANCEVKATNPVKSTRFAKSYSDSKNWRSCCVLA